MTYGPMELLVVEFPGNQFTGSITPALKSLVDSGTIRIVDILFVQKDSDGNVTETELEDLAVEVHDEFAPLVDDWAGLLTHDDAVQLTATLAPDSSAGLLLFENVWASTFAQAIREAHGRVVLNERVPHVVVEELLAARPVTESD